MTAFQINVMREIMPNRNIEAWDMPEHFDEAFEYALRTLKPDCRKALELRFRDNMPLSKMAEILGCKATWARELVQKAILKLWDLEDENLFFDFQNYIRKQETKQKAEQQETARIAQMAQKNPVFTMSIEEIGLPAKECRVLYRGVGRSPLTVGDALKIESLLKLQRCSDVTARNIINAFKALGCDTTKWEAELTHTKKGGQYHGVCRSLTRTGVEGLQSA